VHKLVIKLSESGTMF